MIKLARMIGDGILVFLSTVYYSLMNIGLLKIQPTLRPR